MRKYICFFFIVLLFSCSSINRKLYSSTQVNNPSLKQKNDHSFAFGYSTPSGFDFNGGYAISNRLAIIGGAYNHRNIDKEEEFALFISNESASSRLLYRHKGFHGGAGVFFPLSQNKSTGFASFFAGYVKGNFRMDERYFDNNISTTMPARITFYKSNIGRFFLQGSITAYPENAEISVSTRYNYVEYANVLTDYSLDEQHSYNLPTIGHPSSSQFIDLAFDSKIYFSEHPQWGLQIFGSITPRLKNRDINFHYYPFRLGIGLVVKNLFLKNSKK
jgi:hypothetical protein